MKTNTDLAHIYISRNMGVKTNTDSFVCLFNGKDPQAIEWTTVCGKGVDFYNQPTFLPSQVTCQACASTKVFKQYILDFELKCDGDWEKWYTYYIEGIK